VRRTLALALFLSLPPSARNDEIPDRLSAYMDAAAKIEKFNGSVLVAKGDRILLARGYGLANAEYDIPNTPDTKFRLGSITKQFTATAILILQDQGKLKVEDLISKYLSDAPKAWEKVTIHHLLTHTSGIPSYTDDPSYGKSMTKPETVDSMIARFKDKPLDFEPGSKFHYDNSGYFLLGAIIDKVSGKTYEAFLKAAIFQPLGMTNTGYDRHATVLHKRASGYERRGDGLVNAPYLDMNQPYAAGSLYSTVGDLYKWDRALKAGKLVSKSAMAAMFKPFKDNYAYGWAIGDRKGHKQIGHGGGINGFATDFERYPNEDVCVAVLCNVLPSNPGKVARDLAGIVFGESVCPPKSRVVAKVDPKLYDQYVGKYQLAPKFALTVTRDGDRLITQATGQGKVEIFPESETEFFLKVIDAQITFVKKAGKVSHLILHQNGRDMEAKRVVD
jgi:CubicO group peptidase (beta-lactamase class C family)